jgi:1-deoxy-D-xylulose-5-phosphate reductoisomerase
MQIPIAYALCYPRRIESDLRPLNFYEAGELTFLPPDKERFPSLALAYRAAEEGGTMPAVLNAADEIAVEAFLDRRIRFPEIPVVVEKTMSDHTAKRGCTLKEILEVDGWARERAKSLISNP